MFFDFFKGDLIFARSRSAKSSHPLSSSLSTVSTDNISLPLYDYSNSYILVSTLDHSSHSRMQLDSRCVVIQHESEKRNDFFLGTSCKSEIMYSDRWLFRDPNFDFCGIWSDSDYLIMRTAVTCAPKRIVELEPGKILERYSDSKLHLRKFATKERLLTTIQEVIDSTENNLPLIGRTRIRDEKSQTTVIIEYPIRTMNFSGRRDRFQVDTGPVLWPNFEATSQRWVEKFRLAYLGYNTFSDGEVVLRVPTSIKASGADAGLKAWHYSQIESIKADHEIFCVDEPQVVFVQ